MAGVPLQRTPSFIEMAPRRAIASFENLVALANYQERLTEARKMVWRDRGEPVVELGDLWECLEHAGRGGLRAGTLAFNIRAGVNLFLLVFRFRKLAKNERIAALRHAIFGSDSIRFAAMLASFVSIYKFLINALPMYSPVETYTKRHSFSEFVLDDAEDEDDVDSGNATPSTSTAPPYEKRRSSRPLLSARRPRLSLSVTAQQIMVRKKTRRWHAVVAGAIAGAVAIMFEKKGRRVTIAQQLFVRGLQGSYNALSTKHGFHIPHGDIIVFALMSGQILYGFLLRPDTLPRSYNVWVGQASKVPMEAVKMNRDLVRTGQFDPQDVVKLLKRPDVTRNNRTALFSMYEMATSPEPSFGPAFGPCEAVHPMVDSCTALPFPRFMDVFKWMFPIYGALHFIPMILFKRNAFLKAPKDMLLRAGWGTTRSSAFLATFVIIYQTYFCLKHNLHSFLVSRQALSAYKIPQPLIDVLVSKPSFWIGGLLSGFSLFVEEKRRRGELAMYVLPKGLESVWVMLRGKGLVFNTGNFGEPLLTAIGMGMVMSTYQNDPQHLSGLVRRVMYQFIGPN
ncbi:hypothetical protein JAAARDRAFT_27652 [Jaapia argillacea MUCL 33604]|uniref:Transmembrane protein 135 N-terminal domain-containing protein n=1 Tax=Jaapia argillacea MUCL 33604 TaxID=933084 RepID=A0A067QAA5_9AGAM|nr:hypothetical protein JAAARDRAFT_27652 [Jaapia argillacea MUCL 33604]